MPTVSHYVVKQGHAVDSPNVLFIDCHAAATTTTIVVVNVYLLLKSDPGMWNMTRNTRYVIPNNVGTNEFQMLVGGWQRSELNDVI